MNLKPNKVQTLNNFIFSQPLLSNRLCQISLFWLLTAFQADPIAFWSVWIFKKSRPGQASLKCQSFLFSLVFITSPSKAMARCSLKDTECTQMRPERHRVHPGAAWRTRGIIKPWSALLLLQRDERNGNRNKTMTVYQKSMCFSTFSSPHMPEWGNRTISHQWNIRGNEVSLLVWAVIIKCIMDLHTLSLGCVAASGQCWAGCRLGLWVAGGREAAHTAWVRLWCKGIHVSALLSLWEFSIYLLS